MFTNVARGGLSAVRIDLNPKRLRTTVLRIPKWFPFFLFIIVISLSVSGKEHCKKWVLFIYLFYCIQCNWSRFSKITANKTLSLEVELCISGTLITHHFKNICMCQRLVVLLMFLNNIRMKWLSFQLWDAKLVHIDPAVCVKVKNTYIILFLTAWEILLATVRFYCCCMIQYCCSMSKCLAFQSNCI